MLSDITCLIKRRDNAPSQRLHVDQNSAPPPLPPHPQLLNLTWTLTDYTMENGPLAVVPSSHRFGRGPSPHEEEHLGDDSPIKPIPVLCDAGSVVAFGGTTWHSSFPRMAPGLRITLVFMFCRPYMKQMHDFRLGTPEGVLERNPEFARLLGINYLYPMNSAEKPTGGDGIGPDVQPKVLEEFWAGGRHFWG
jgi:ectoine hydroxylase-related dioxygenase (phytanoyl-CoA dioxygenase family)